MPVHWSIYTCCTPACASSVRDSTAARFWIWTATNSWVGFSCLGTFSSDNLFIVIWWDRKQSHPCRLFFFLGQSWGVSNRICTVSNSTHAAFTWDSSLKWCSGGEMRHVVACMQGNRHRGAKQPSACCSDSVRWWWLLSVSSKHLPGKIYRGYLSKVIIHSKWKCHSLPHISKPKSLLMTLGGGDDSWMSPTKQPHPSFMNGSSL